jgi:hypothetical protein
LTPSEIPIVLEKVNTHVSIFNFACYKDREDSQGISGSISGEQHLSSAHARLVAHLWWVGTGAKAKKKNFVCVYNLNIIIFLTQQIEYYYYSYYFEFILQNWLRSLSLFSD